VLEQFDGNCVQDRAKLCEESAVIYSVFSLYAIPSAVCHMKVAEKVPRLYSYSPKKSLLPKSPRQDYPDSIMSV
jgi:hypothetical protein